jgi:hypothetical protein
MKAKVEAIAKVNEEEGTISFSFAVLVEGCSKEA